jgi:hypothetical protein
MLLTAYPVFAEEPPVFVDWLHWNHVLWVFQDFPNFVLASSKQATTTE